MNFLDRISKNSQISNLIKTHQVGAVLLYVDGRTDGHDEDNIHFSPICERALNKPYIKMSKGYSSVIVLNRN